MDHAAVKEWLTEFKSLNSHDYSLYYGRIKDKTSLVTSLHEVLEKTETEFQEKVCHQLLEFYRTDDVGLKKFTMQFVPTVVWMFLLANETRDRKASSRFEALLLGIYNLEVMEKDGSPKFRMLTVPTLNRTSIYHEPMTLANLALAELTRLDREKQGVFYDGPYLQYEHINAKNRLLVLSAILRRYNAVSCLMPSASHHVYCHMCTRLAMSGFGNIIPSTHSNYDDALSSPRITLSQQFLLEMIHGIYSILFTGPYSAASNALEDMHSRASYELYPECLLLTNAIQHSLSNCLLAELRTCRPQLVHQESIPSSHPKTGVAKSAVTNLSFKIRRASCKNRDKERQSGAGQQEMHENGPLATITEQAQPKSSGVSTTAPVEASKFTGNISANKAKPGWKHELAAHSDKPLPSLKPLSLHRDEYSVSKWDESVTTETSSPGSYTSTTGVKNRQAWKNSHTTDSVSYHESNQTAGKSLDGNYNSYNVSYSKAGVQGDHWNPDKATLGHKERPQSLTQLHLGGYETSI